MVERADTAAGRDEEIWLRYGTVAWFDPQRGVGAIHPDEGGAEVHVHSAQIDGGGLQSLQENDRVAFTLVDGPSGPQAAEVHAP